jgi:hypothetical protein
MVIQELYLSDDLTKKVNNQLEKELNISIVVNLSESEIRQIGLQCRYGIKLDHTGIADNTSTIVSCLGMY